jgi:hypothetical protein
VTNNSQKYHLAEFNFAKAMAPMEDPKLKDFVDGSPAVNAIADSSPGFIWRYQPEGMETFNIRPFEDQSIYITLSVWESVEALKNFVFKSGHGGYLKRRKEWFHPLDPHLVMWWIRAGHLPTVEEARSKLEILKNKGASPEAFDFTKQFPSPTLANP